MNINQLMQEYNAYASTCLENWQQAGDDWARDCKSNIRKLYRVKNLSVKGAVRNFMLKNHIDPVDHYDQYALLLQLLRGSVSVNDIVVKKEET